MIIEHQELDGHFESLPDKYASLLEKEVPSDLLPLLKNEEDFLLAWVTIVALLVLEQDCKKDKDEWAMIAKKAKGWLKKKLTPGADYQEFKSVLG